MKKKTICSALLLTSAVLILGACGSDKKAKDGEGDVTTLTFFNKDLQKDDKFDNPVAKEITKKTGVKLEISHPVGGDEQAIPLMIASGDYPDIIFGKGDLNKLIDANAVIPLDEMIEKKGDNIKKLYGDQLDRLRNSLDDPQIYHLGTGGVENAYYKTSGTFSIQLDVLKELGYPEIRTLDDFEKAIAAYKEKYPEIDGQETIGLSLLGSDWRWLITVGNPAGFASGLQDDGQWAVDDKTGETVYKFQLPEFKEYFKWLNSMNAKGLLDPESFTQKADTYIAKLSSGRVLGIADQDWNYQDAVKNLKADDKEWRLYAPLPVTLNENLLSQGVKDYGFTGTTGVSISSTSENQDKAFEFLNWMASEEAQILVNWGVEGVNYDIKDGKRVAKPEDLKASQTDTNYQTKTGIGAYGWPFPQWGTAAVDSAGQSISRDTKEQVINDFTDAEKEVLAEYDAELWVDLFPKPEELGTSDHGKAYEYVLPSESDASIIQTKADDYVTQTVTKAILADPQDFDKIWEDMQKELEKIGIEKANNEMTQLTQDRIKLWSGEFKK
ncbi:ABC transporter substrate-binding protein [Vagococcus acidifermentans]|uniref:Sugar ABC transporter substrate-binding protein n=1 Tax=Vagococcus acidifermentans TaxID=564710 RepID=A0A430B2E0_9ENTE|nr:ABC transporter substrate-binding protein [Vagococcus acidifermentans]RSU14495.1 sugar ABC transporter substrate-binding protein [Vagococcus acidifermentans]